MRGGALIAARRLRNFCPKERRRGEKQSSGLFFGGDSRLSARSVLLPSAEVSTGHPHPSPGVPHNLTPFVHIAKRHILFLHATRDAFRRPPFLCFLPFFGALMRACRGGKPPHLNFGKICGKIPAENIAKSQISDLQKGVPDAGRVTRSIYVG